MRLAVGLLTLLALSGCSSVSASAVRTGPVQLPAYSGPVAVYVTGPPPPGAVELGVVEVHAAQQEANVDALLPLFLRKVAQIGGNVAVIDSVRARFHVVGHMHIETFYATCVMGATCGNTRMYSTDNEIMVVSMSGHAMTTRSAAHESPGAAPLDSQERDGSRLP